jgi:CubicO group peptidase (beta-lactamase class C family)
MKQSRCIGLSVCIIDSNKTLLSEGFGYADLATKKTVTSKTIFQIGSISKVITAIAIMQLVNKGKVSLDSSITTYIPEFSIKSHSMYQPVTIRDLLTHESGLPSDVANGCILGQSRFSGIDTLYRIVPFIFKDLYTARPPKTSFSYSNIGFSLLGCIIERVSGQSLSDYISDHIFMPTHMLNSSTQIDSIINNDLSMSYRNNNPIPVAFIRDIPAGAYLSNADDIAQFIKMLLAKGHLNNNTILDNSYVDTMLSCHNTDIPLDLNFKIGLPFWLTNPTNIPSKIAYHIGDIPPNHSVLAILPDKQLGIAVMINSDDDPLLAVKIGLHLLEKFYEAKYGKQIGPQKPPPSIKLNPSRLKQLAGVYTCANTIFQISVSGDKLTMNNGSAALQLTAQSDSIFIPKYKLFGFLPIHVDQLNDLTVGFHKIDDKELLSIRVFGISLERAVKYKVPSITNIWRKRAGNYVVINQQSIPPAEKFMKDFYYCNSCNLSIDKETSILLFKPEGKGIVPLQIHSDSIAISCGAGRNSGETVEAYSDNNGDYIKVWGYTFKRCN